MLKNDDIIGLCRIHDIRPSFVSVYLKRADGWSRYLRKRESTCMRALETHPEILDNFKICIQKIKNEIDDMSGPYCAFFYNHLKNFYYKLDVPSIVPETLVVDSSPYVIHLIQTLEDWETYIILLIDSTHAVTYIAEGEEITLEDEREKDIIGKHRKGGMSQRRFQRKREISIGHFFKDISEHLSKIIYDRKIKRIVIAGPPGPKERFIQYLPKDVRSRIIGVISESMKISSEELLHNADKVFEKAEANEEKEFDEMFKKEVMRGHHASYDLNEIINASINGRIEILFLEKDKIIRGWKCEKCGIFDYGVKNKCPTCHHETLTVNLIEEIVEEVVKHRGDVEFLSMPEFLRSVGGIGAILRY